MNPQDIAEGFVKDVYASRDIRLCDKKFLEIWPKLKAEYGMNTGLTLEISCTYRSPKAQNDLFQIGRTKPGKILTNCDGYDKISKHNLCPSRAIDVYALIIGKAVAVWDIDAYEALDKLAKQFDLIWGGNWKEFPDRCHLELIS